MRLQSTLKKQQGFTIIELVVVILLLGILAATALPRFIDVTTQAHDSAFQGTAGGLITGVSLYRAEWTARGQPAANVPLQSYGGLRAAPGYSNGAYVADTGAGDSSFTAPATFTGRSLGYPLATNAAINKGTFAASHCVEVFENALQAGAPSIRVHTTSTLGNLPDEAAADIRTAASNAAANSAADFYAFTATVEINTGFARAGAEIGAAGTPSNYEDTVPGCVYIYTGEAENFDRAILYVPWTGRVESYETIEALIAASEYDGPTV